MASRPTTADRGSGTATLSATEFEQALRQATAVVRSHGFGPWSAPIPELRRALGTRVSRGEFDQGLCRLRDDGTIGLEPHAHPDCLGSIEIQDALAEGPSLLYLLRWLK